MISRKVTIAGILLLILVALPYLSLYPLVRTPQFQRWIQAELGQRTGYEIKFDDLRLGPPFRIITSALIVSRSGQVLFQGHRVTLSVTPLDIFLKRVYRLSLEKPVVRVKLKDLFRPTEKSFNISIRLLNIEDGEFVLETGDGESLPLRSIYLRAENLNLGRETGVVMKAYLPWLEGDASLHLRGPSDLREAEIHIRQSSPRGLTGLFRQDDKAAGVLKAHLNLKEEGDKSYKLAASGDLHEFKLGTEKITGNFKSRLDLDAELKGVGVSFQLSLPQFPSKIGRMDLSVPTGPTTVTLAGRYLVPEKVLAIQGIKMVAPFGSAAGKGEVVLVGKPATRNMTLRVHSIPLNLLKPLLPKAVSSLGFSGTASADLHLSGPLNSLVIKGVAQSQEAKIQGEKFNFSRLSIKAPFEFAKSSLHAKGMRIEGKGLTFGRKGEVQFEAGEMNLDGDIGKNQNEPMKAEAQFQIVQGRFSTPDGSKVGEQLAARGNVSFANGLQDNRIPFKGKVEITGLELLWGTFFGDFKEQRPVIEAEGDYLADRDEVRVGQANIMLRSLGNVELKGVIQGLAQQTGFNLDVWTQDFRPAGFYDFFIRDAFKRTYPILGKLRIAGKSSWNLHLQGSLREFSAEGSMKLQEGEIQEQSNKWRIGPMEMALPFKFHYPRAVREEASEKSQTGNLVVQGATLGSTTIPPVKTLFALWNNSLRFLQPIHLSLYGGSIVVKDLAWKDLVGLPKDLSFSVDLNDVPLHQLTEALGWHRFGGNLSGSLPQVQWRENSLLGKGELRLELFGGRVTVKGMEIQEPFSSLPSIKMNLRLEEIDLERASETFEFGRISGILQGTIDDLVVTRGQAAQFTANLHTVEKGGVSQWISVDALNNISVLSSGSEAGFLYGGIAGFFDYFRYSKLGFKAELKNDKLILRGIESKEGKEYLVVGTFLPPTVNIISHTQEIGFTELMRRLERVREPGKDERPKAKTEGS